MGTVLLGYASIFFSFALILLSFLLQRGLYVNTLGIDSKLFSSKFQLCEGSWLVWHKYSSKASSVLCCGLFMCLCLCAWVQVCSCNQPLLLESCAVHRFFCITVGAGGLSFWPIDIWSFCLLHDGAIKAGGKVTGCSCGAPGSPHGRQKSPLNFSPGGTMTMIIVVTDGAVAEWIRRRAKWSRTGKLQSREGWSEVMLTCLVLLSPENVAPFSCSVWKACPWWWMCFFPLMSIFQISHWPSHLSDACDWYLVVPRGTEPFRKPTAELPRINHEAALIWVVDHSRAG